MNISDYLSLSGVQVPGSALNRGLRVSSGDVCRGSCAMIAPVRLLLGRVSVSLNTVEERRVGEDEMRMVR